MENSEYELYIKCLLNAQDLINKGYVLGDIHVDELADTLYKLEVEKLEKNKKSDQLIDYNDEIISIEDVGIMETIDISVSGDNLFYCNGILTKNSFGLPATADFMFALINTEELESMNQIMVKQLKNRFNDPSLNKRFVIGIDRSKMKLFDVEDSAQEDIVDSGKEKKNISFSPKDKFSKLRV